ncbi:MAG TPA: HipA family kinase [Gemmatirosa sp.]|nr:HipA family kinase [Gemmatirosa sp.]
MHPLPTHTALRYVAPLREGGSLPAVVEVEDGTLWVAKFRGAGQGARVLIAELVVGGLARALGLPVPDLAVVELPEEFGRLERDPEIQELLRRSTGVNIGMRYLDGAFNFDALAAGEFVDAALAARIVWLDAFTTNPDRTARNPNLLVWERRPWLIDHGAALYVHHDWRAVDAARTRAPFPLVRTHVLLAASGDLRAADAELAPQVTAACVDAVLAAVPDALFDDPSGPVGAGELADAAAARARYAEYLLTRVAAPRAFVDAAVASRDEARRTPAARLQARR